MVTLAKDLCHSGCDSNQKGFINQAYSEAHTIVNVDGVKANIQWESEAAVDFFGPPQLNKDEQAQIQAVLANIETVQPGWWFNPLGWSLQVRCDNPKNNCNRGVTAYTLNPSGNEKPFINFCPNFFRRYTLEQAVNNYKDDDNLEVKWNVDYYVNRGLVFLHELFHVDIAADSERGTPNPKIYDILIRYDNPKGEPQVARKAYTAKYSKLLARFLPKGNNAKSTGYWVQRNVDNFSRFAMAKYLEGRIGGYPFLPIIYDNLTEPLRPDPRPGKSSLISFQAENKDDAKLDFDTLDDPDAFDGEANVDATHLTDETFDVGRPIGLDDYPDSYKKACAGWLDMLKSKGDGTCKIQVKEIWTCGDAASNLYASLKITSKDGKTVYTTPGSASSPGQPINDGHPLTVTESGMDDTLTLVGEQTNDYIQFGYGFTSWTSGDTTGDASCKLVGDNWDQNGPQGCPNAMAVTRSFECQYPCGT